MCRDRHVQEIGALTLEAAKADFEASWRNGSRGRSWARCPEPLGAGGPPLPLGCGDLPQPLRRNFLAATRIAKRRLTTV
jgi:hypothetical protein